MTARRKRALLASIEGQLEAVNGDESTARRWRRIGGWMDALASMPCDDFETARLARLQRHVAAMLEISRGRRSAWLSLQRRTLARADCIIWQMYLRRCGAASVPGTTWPPRGWRIPGDNPTFPGHPIKLWR